MKRKRDVVDSLDSKHYSVGTKARWYWLTTALCLLTALSVFVLPESYPVIYIRYVLGSTLVFWMPGYALVRSLFLREKHDRLELAALSVGTSTVLVSMTALLLSYTPWGIKTASITIALLILTLTLSTLALFREMRAQNQKLARYRAYES